MMNITAIKSTNYKHNVYFSARFSEKEIIQQVETLIRDKASPVIMKNLEYFQDMRKGADIPEVRKSQINQWIDDKLFEVEAFFKEREESVLRREYVKSKEKHTIGGDLRKGIKKTVKTVKSIFGSPEKEPRLALPHQSEPEDVSFFRKFSDLFYSYRGLKPRVVETPATEETLEELLRKFDMEHLGISPQAYKEAEELRPRLLLDVPAQKPAVKETPAIKYQPGDPRTLLGIEEGEAKKLRSQFETYKTKYWDEEWYALHKEEYRALEAKIRKYNISVVDKKVFSENPLEQITEKHKYIQEILGRAEYNEASYYDALLMFEKYGTREEYRDVGTSTLSQIKTALPKNPTEKTVNKVMDIYEKYGKFYMDGDELGLSDGLSYMTIIAKKDVIKTEEQLKRALNKGKNIIWNNDAIYDLHYALTKAQNAPMKESQSVKNVIDQFYETAYANRTAYKDHLDIKMMEESWDIKRD